MYFFFFQAEDGIRDIGVTGVQTCALPISNGVDYEVWNPETDPHIPAHYSSEDLSGKRACKLELLRKFGLPEEADRPVVASISRLVSQKGFDLVRQVAWPMLEAVGISSCRGCGAVGVGGLFP